MKKILALLIALTMVGFMLTFLASPAQATRPVPGYNYTDQCKNIKGVQPAYLLVGTGPYRFKNAARKTCYHRSACVVKGQTNFKLRRYCTTPVRPTY